ncbi:MAG: alpha-glucosidase [Oscillospiraceae bacterium]|nr:alpha-glucosidase [Oscillospiraceae bacterium]
MEQFDYKSMSLYQIWIRSFCDGNGDGIGDLYGVYDKLEYIRSLGVDGIWFSPIYPSPNADYGYDISDYKNIHPDYGDLEQFKKVLDKAHGLGLKVILDLVINHTSDEHPWFLESRKGKDNPYSDYYIWRDPKWKRSRKRPPNNWFSQFEGLAWEYGEEREQYYLHVFAKKQPDLNMDNPKVREEVKSVMRFWLDMGVDGFREDVITFISKHPQLPDGIPFLPAINGLPFYKDGPNLMTYLRQFREVAKEYGALQIGEAPMTPVKTALRYLTGEDRVLDMMIQFDTMMADCFMTEYIHHGFRLKKLKRAFSRWQNALAGKAWNALYLENHDHPRVISRYGSEKYWRESGTMLAACYLFQQGTPFIYQGQEIGMTNIRLPSIEHYQDVASINAYHSYHKREPEEKRMRRIHVSSRDSARTPMQWNGGPNAGFTDAQVRPWFAVNPNYPEVNAEREEGDPSSILNFYRRCLRLRKNNKTLLSGSYREYCKGSRKFYVYERYAEDERILVICSFSDHEEKIRLPKGYDGQTAELVLDNYPKPESGIFSPFRPYEVRVLRWE